MKHKTNSWILIFFLILSIFTTINITNPTLHVVKADELIYENEYGRMTVSPATSHNLIHQEQYCNITWYKPDNSIDVAFRFNDSLNGGKIQYYNNNQWNNVSMSHTIYNNKHYYYYTGFNVEQDHTYQFRWYYDVQPGSSGKWDFLAKLSSDTIQEALDSGRYILLDPWWDSDWNKRKDIYIDHTQVNTTLKNFPIYINISDAEMVGDVQTDLGDIVFVANDNQTKLDHEIEYYSIGATVEARIWVEVNKINGSDHTDDTHIDMYYGNSGCANQANPTGVWDSNYVAVYHMNASDGGTKINGCYDSTSNKNHATFNGSDLPDQINGIVGYGQSIDGSGDWIYRNNAGGDNIADNIDGTWEAWVDSDNIEENDVVMKLYASSSAYIYFSQRKDIAPDRWDYRGDYGAPEWNDGYIEQRTNDFQWFCQHWADNDEAVLWLDGRPIIVTSSIDTGSISSGYYYFGADAGTDSSVLNGILDEIRISNIKRNDSWMEASYRTVKNSTTFVTIGAEKVDGVTTNPITSLTVETQNKNYIAVNWTRSTNGNYTIVERNIASGWVRGDGTQLYNGTDNSYNDTNCTQSTVYYYQLWAFNEITHNFSNVESDDNHTGPLNPTGVTASVSGNSVTLGWTKGTRGDKTVICRKSGSYPSSISDGTQIYNNTGTSHVDTGWTNNMRYMIYAFATDTNTDSSGVTAGWGSLNVTCYQENSSIQIFNFTVFVSNQSGTETYEEYSNGNASVIIDVNNLPTGDNVVVKVNASVYINATKTNSYYDRVYYMDLVPDNYYELKAYLPLKTDSYLYRLIVYGPVGEYNTNYPISGATVNIKRYINSTNGWDSIGIYITDGDGNIYVYLIPGELYKVTISATNYITAISDYIPSSNVFEQIFRLAASSTGTDELIYDNFWEDITITPSMISSGFFSNGNPQLGNITIIYSDSNSSTTNTYIRLYELYNGTLTLLNTWSNTSTVFNLVNHSINTTRYHYLTVHFNTTATYQINQPIVIQIPSIDNYINVVPFDIDDRIDKIIGDFKIEGQEVPWTTIIAISLPLILLVCFGPFNTGLGIISCGLSMSFIEGMLGAYNISGFHWGIAGLGIFIVVVGIFYIMSKQQGGENL